SLPPLRRRRGDIATLASHLLARISAEHDAGATPLVLDPEARDALAAHDWPGNVRELRNLLERAALLTHASGGGELRLAPLLLRAPAGSSAQAKPASVAPPAAAASALGLDANQSYRENRARFEAEFERGYVRWLLARHDGN